MHKQSLRLTSSIGHRLTDMRTMVLALSGIYKAGTLDRPYAPSRELFVKMAEHIQAATESHDAAVDLMHSADRLKLYGKTVDTLNKKLGNDPKKTAAVIYGEKFGLTDRNKIRVYMSGVGYSLDMPELLAGIKNNVPNFDLDRPARPKDAVGVAPKDAPSGP